jgi:hypothetical protein
MFEHRMQPKRMKSNISLFTVNRLFGKLSGLLVAALVLAVCRPRLTQPWLFNDAEKKPADDAGRGE